MTRRQLDEEERKISEKMLGKHKKFVIDTKETLDYNNSLLAKHKYLQEFDDKHRKYLRNLKDKEDSAIIKVIEKDIKNSEEHIQQLTEDIEKGVVIKKVLGIE